MGVNVADKRPFGSDHCSVCRREDVAEVNSALASNRSVRSVAILHAIRYETLLAHATNHVYTDKYQQGKIAIGFQDIVAIPISMKERREMQDALIARILAPVMNSSYPSALRQVQQNFLINLWNLQMKDEQTILRVAGVLKEGSELEGSKESHAQLARFIEARLDALAEGDWSAKAQAKLMLAEAVDPREDLPVGRGASANDLSFLLDEVGATPTVEWEGEEAWGDDE